MTRGARYRLLAVVYASQFVPLAFLLYGLSAVLREREVPLERIAFVQLLGLVWVKAPSAEISQQASHLRPQAFGRHCRQTPSTHRDALFSAGNAPGSLPTDLATSPMDAISPGLRGVSSTTSPECVVMLNWHGVTPPGLETNSRRDGRYPPGASVV